jgi:AcrR family transcriptional regulator
MARDRDPITSIWTRPARTPRGEGPTLSQEQIAVAALKLLDEGGVTGLSMRRLGAELGAGATSLYWYVANKDELLDLVLDEIMAEVLIPDPDEVGWQAAAIGLARGMRQMILAHPWVPSLFGVRPNNGPKSLAVTDQALKVMQAAGFTAMDQAYACSLLVHHAIGAGTAAAALHQTMRRTGMSQQELTAAVVEYQDSLVGKYPNTDAWWQQTRAADIEQMTTDSFDFGLDRLMDGLRSWLDRSGDPAAGRPAPPPPPA